MDEQKILEEDSQPMMSEYICVPTPTITFSLLLLRQ